MGNIYEQEYPLFSRDRHDLCISRCYPSRVIYHSPDAQERQRECNHRLSLWKALNKHSLAIKTLIEDLEFVLKLRQYWGEGPGNASCQVAIAEDEDLEIRRKDFPDELELLKARQKSTMDELNFVLSEWSSSRIPFQFGWLALDEDDAIYFRLQLSFSKTRYFPQLGLLSSNYRRTTFHKPIKEDFVNHMNGKLTPSPYISISNSAGRILNLCRYRNNDGTYNWNHWNKYMVIAISKNRMASLGVTVKATTELKKQFDCSGSNVSYITASHFLAEHCIPEEAFVRVFSLGEFMEMAREHHVLEISTNKDGKSGAEVKLT